MTEKWTARDIPDQSGRVAVVTGANSGLGLSTSRELARAGAHVVMAVRNTEKAREVAADLPGDIEVRELDLADLDSVARFVDDLPGDVDVLVNNAGVMAVPLSRTKQGFESQFGVNHLGHFALTGRLLPRITDRVVALSSAAHRGGTISLDDPNWERRRYRRWGAYGQSKLANLMFSYEFQRRAIAHESMRRSVAAHPGLASTELFTHTGYPGQSVINLFTRTFGQNADMGALPTLYAATVTDVPGGWYIGPDGPAEIGGYPAAAGSSRRSHDPVLARQLWELLERLTGIAYEW